MRRIPACVEVDEAVGVGYIAVRPEENCDGAVVRSVMVGELILDFDSDGQLVGVEVLDLSIFDTPAPESPNPRSAA